MSDFFSRIRLVFSKRESSAYISHLDLMTTLTRVFLRAGLSLKHTEGFNPHPYISLARPLSLGYESGCELCDIVLTAPEELSALPDKLNACSPRGIRFTLAYTDGGNASDITHSRYRTVYTFPSAVGSDIAERGLAVLRRKSLTVPKKNKKLQMIPTEIAPMIKDVDAAFSDGALTLVSELADGIAGGLNPAYLTAALRAELPDFAPLLAEYTREAFLTADGKVFR